MVFLAGMVKANVSSLSTFTVNVQEFQADAGQFVGIEGFSGAGKTTVLDVLGLHCPPDAVNNFTYEFSGKKYELTTDSCPAMLDKLRGHYISFVNQQCSLLPYFNLIDNVTLPAELLNQVDKGFIQRLLRVFGLSDFGNRFPNELSAGQKQRVAIVRALASKPQLILLDEPTSALNDEMSELVVREITDYTQQHKSTCVIVSHDLSLLQKACSSRYQMVVKGEGDDTIDSQLLKVKE